MNTEVVGDFLATTDAYALTDAPEDVKKDLHLSEVRIKVRALMKKEVVK